MPYGDMPKEDRNTIQGAVFDHKGETAGLGAEITQEWFQERFKNEKIFNAQGELVGINVSKTNNDPPAIRDHEVMLFLVPLLQGMA